MPKSRIPSPARSQGAAVTPRRDRPRRTRSVASPALSTASGRLTSVVEQFKQQNMESFALSPLNSRRSVLSDNTDIEEPRRKSWWKGLNENSRDVMEVLEENKVVDRIAAIEELFDIEVLSQEKNNRTLDLPDSSDSESIQSIVLPQRKLFTQKENQVTKKFGKLIVTRESLAKEKNTTNYDKTLNAGTKELFARSKRTKPVFPTALLNISPNKTSVDISKEFAGEPKPTRNIFGNRPANKRKNMFYNANFIVSDSEDDILEIQPKVFGFQRKAQSPVAHANVTVDMDDWRHLPSSTMVEHQIEEEMCTPVKRARLDKEETEKIDVLINKSKSTINKSDVLTQVNVSKTNANNSRNLRTSVRKSRKDEEAKESCDKQATDSENAIENKEIFIDGVVDGAEGENENVYDSENDAAKVGDVVSSNKNKVISEGSEDAENESDNNSAIDEDANDGEEIASDNKDHEDQEVEENDDDSKDNSALSHTNDNQDNDNESNGVLQNVVDDEENEANENQINNETVDEVSEEIEDALNDSNVEDDSKQITADKSQIEDEVEEVLANVSQIEDVNKSRVISDDDNDDDERQDEEENEIQDEEEDVRGSRVENDDVNESLIEDEANENDADVTNESDEVENDQEMEDSDGADKAIASDTDPQDEQTEERELDEDEEDSQELKYESEVEEDDLEQNEEIEDTPDMTHDTTGRNRNKPVDKSPEVILHDMTNQENSFTARGRNTSVRQTMLKSLHIQPSMVTVRESIGIPDSTTNSSAEGSGWDSHRTTRKTLRQTMGKDFTLRKSLRALVMEKSAKRQTEHVEMQSETAKFPQANSTELPNEANYEIEETMEESDHDMSKETRQRTLEMDMHKLKEQIMEERLKIEEAVRKKFQKAPTRDPLNLFIVPTKAAPRRPRPSTKPKKQAKTVIPMEYLPAEILEDFNYKPPKRFRPSNASWITKRLYKFLETKLEPKYDYRARVRAEKLVEMIYQFVKDLRRRDVASLDAIDMLKQEMARLDVVKTHHDFYQFFHDYMPREVRVKVNPDIVNNIPIPRHGVFSDILRGNTV